ncbi:LPXTG cell wall anchor domain-containing protein [Kitasatospora sp. YST-16]|nr:LAETG motif-containing sortase-dependent surface protein [Kitasatospora sp. YST-16]WAL71888.1 LPXTG cell wall anchor domain-containing protein [Kitasatospora sp. YST-16]WNW37932.1 LAETG motif-containing sortase-dependent surface protein [Streptomyces sp. Li-HN-5-13]
MNTRRSVSSAAAATKVAAAAALVLAATAVAGGTAWATDRPVVPCADGAVKLPGENAVEGAPAHTGTVSLQVGGDAAPTVAGDVATYRLRITESNRTGAGYRHVTVVPVLFTQLGVMNTGNTKVTWVHGGTETELPTRMGCDPSIWGASGALDLALADGQTATVELKVTTSTEVARKVKELSVSARGAADGDRSLESNLITLPGVAPASEPTAMPTKKPTEPTATPTKPATPTPTATPTKAPAASATPTATAATPAPAAASAELASTGGGSNTGLLAAAAALLIAAGGAVLYTLRRRTR